MGNLLNKIVDNNILFIGVIIGLCLVLGILILLIIRAVKENKKINIYEEELEDEEIKKVKNVKKEDIIETPDIEEYDDKTIEIELEELKEESYIIEEKEEIEELEEEKSYDYEIEERYEEEKEKEIEEVKEETKNSELEELISRMEQDSKMKPEEVVANFEKEQEAQSIISYQELVNAVKNRKEEIYEDELESKPLTTVSDFMKIRESENEEYEEIDELTVEENKESTFKSTDFISPVFGRMESNTNKDGARKKIEKVIKHEVKYPSSDETIDLTNIILSDDKIEKKEVKTKDNVTALDEIYNHMAIDLLKGNDDLGETASLEELTKNEEFLQSLKDFRKKL